MKTFKGKGIRSVIENTGENCYSIISIGRFFNGDFNVVGYGKDGHGMASGEKVLKGRNIVVSKVNNTAAKEIQRGVA